MRVLHLFSTLVTLYISPASSHVGPYGPGMYCKQGVDGTDNNNANDVSQPLWNLTREDWWWPHENGCDQFPPPDGEFLMLPAGGYVTLELSVNRAFTSTSANPLLDEFPNGQPEILDSGRSEEGCVVEPNITSLAPLASEEEEAGTALAISYESDLANVKEENLFVISVAYNTPWRRLADYHIPDLPNCPEGVCRCAWGWLPVGCGRPDMYMHGFKCNIENGYDATENQIPPAAPPVWCEDDPANCVVGPKQMIFFHQSDGNNVVVEGPDIHGREKTPAYDMRMGFPDGAQWDVAPDPDVYIYENQKSPPEANSAMRRWSILIF